MRKIGSWVCVPKAERVGDYVELDDKAIILGQNGSLLYNLAEIKKVKPAGLGHCWEDRLL